MKNIPVSNKLSKVIIAKDLTIQQRDQNKKKRELKNKNNKQSLQKTKASEMKTIQEEVDDMEIQNCQRHRPRLLHSGHYTTCTNK